MVKFTQLFFALIAFIGFSSFWCLTTFGQAPLKQWDRTIGGNGSDRFYSLDQTIDGGYIVGGSSTSGISGDKTQASASGSEDYWIVKLNSSGIKQWDKTFTGNSLDYNTCVLKTLDGGIILGGFSSSGIGGDKSETSKGKYDLWIIKLNAAGVKIWDRTIGGSGDEYLYSMQQTTDGGYILGGWSDSGVSGNKTQPSKGLEDYWIVKLDGAGNILWDKAFGGNGIDKLRCIQQTADGGYILGGWSESGISGDKTQASNGNYDFWITKIDSSGNKIWDKSFGGDGVDLLYSLKQTSDLGYILGGFSTSNISGDKSEPLKGGAYDCWVIKIDSLGNKTWDKTFGGNGTDNLTGLFQTIDGGYILGCYSGSGVCPDKTEPNRGLNSYDDYWLIKIDANGIKQWDKSYGGIYEDELHSIQNTPDGGIILGGLSNSGVSADKSEPHKGGNFDYWIVKLASEITGIPKIKSLLNLTIYPNPNKGEFLINATKLNSKTAEITVLDMLGRTVYQQQIPTSENQLQHQINLPEAKGMYMLQVKTGNQTTTRKIIVQ